MDVASATPAHRGPDGLVRLLRDIRREADARGVPVRALGGIGVLLRAGRPHPALTRAYEDLDVAVPARTRADVEATMAALGLRPEPRFNALHGERRQIWWTPDSETHVDVFIGEFRMCHRLEFAASLATEHDALPAADLILTKLQVVELTRKDVTDAAALLLTHELSDRQAAGVIDAGRLADVLTRDWGFYTTVTENLERLPGLVEGLEPQLCDRIREAASLIRGRIERAPKSRRYQLRSKIGKRVQWYTTPDSSL